MALFPNSDAVLPIPVLSQQEQEQLTCVPLGHRSELPPPPPRASVTSSFERLIQKMKDASNLPREEPPAVLITHKPPMNPEPSRRLRRTSSCASLETICAANANTSSSSSKKSVRKRILQTGLKTLGSKKQPKDQDATKKNRIKHSPAETNDRERSPGVETMSDSEHSSGRKQGKNDRKESRVMQDISVALTSTAEEDISDISARLLESAPTVAWALHPSLFSCLADEPLTGVCNSPSSSDHQDYRFFTRDLKPGPHVNDQSEKTCELSQIGAVQVGIEDLSLIIRPHEPDVTIWNGDEATHHIFKCYLFLRCTAQPFDILALPDVRRIEIVCTTLPVGRSYALGSPVLLQTSFRGACVDLPISPSDKPAEVDPREGIHVSKTWHAMMDSDGTWGWYAAVFVPVPVRLFAKIEFRRFEMVGRLWVGEEVLEGVLVFGMSMLVDMK